MYINLHTGEVVTDESAYNYAKLGLDALSDEDKEMFVEWFYSGNWIHRTQEQLEQERALGGIGAYCIDKMISEGGHVYG